MVGKGVEAKSSRIFHQCYLKCCKLQNLTPLATVIPGSNGKVLDFCVDRIKYADWPPILNALSCDLSLHSVSIRCRQPVKTVLEHIDCERLAKTVNKRCVLLTNFMLTNLVEAVAQILGNTTLLATLLLEGMPLKIPYLNPLCESLLANSSLQHLYLPRCLIGDAGCLAVCKAVRCLPNILTLDLSGCELTCAGAGYIADLIKYQKIHRYSENWVHTLRYRFPELDNMAGLRRITVCANPLLGDQGAAKLLDVLADDLWIKALDVQNCGLTEKTAQTVMEIMSSNTTLVILDLRHNAEICSESLSRVRAALREHERVKGVAGQYSWLGTASGYSHDGRSVKSIASKNTLLKDRLASNTRNASSKYAKTTVTKKEKDYTETLEEQLQEEISHRQQLEELNMQLVDQMKQLKQQQIQLWAQSGATSSGSEQSFEASDLSSSSGSTGSVPIDQNTLAYIQHAFRDIYQFIKNNQCYGQCHPEPIAETQDREDKPPSIKAEPVEGQIELVSNATVRIAKRGANSTHHKMTYKVEKTSKSAHVIGDTTPVRSHRENVDMKLEMFERQMGDSKAAHVEEYVTEDIMAAQYKDKKCFEPIQSPPSPCSSVVSDSSETLVVSSHHSECSERSQRSQRSQRSERSRSSRERSRSARLLRLPPNPRDAFNSSSDDDTDDSARMV